MDVGSKSHATDCNDSNHDTFPHAFTAFPYENDLLPANAFYPTQELYNYENVSAAWDNYGWLSAEEAQMVVASGLGIYRATTADGLVIISLNSDVWYYFNLYACKSPLSRLQWKHILNSHQTSVSTQSTPQECSASLSTTS